MTISELKKLVCDIVEQASKLKNKHTDQYEAPVHYACIFAQSQKEYDELTKAIKGWGKDKEETPRGIVYEMEPLLTAGGPLRLVKIRTPDPTRTELGDADFAANDYDGFKENVLKLLGFKLIPRENFEMIELMDPAFNVRVYFSNPPVEEQLGLIR